VLCSVTDHLASTLKQHHLCKAVLAPDITTHTKRKGESLAPVDQFIALNLQMCLINSVVQWHPVKGCNWLAYFLCIHKPCKP
jgi:hypothetical protein